MLESIKNFIMGIYNHYAALTGFLFFLAIFKFVFPLFMYFLTEVTNRVEEKRSVKAYVKAGLPLDQAQKWARSTWRPKKKPSFLRKFFRRILLLFSKKSDT